MVLASCGKQFSIRDGKRGIFYTKETNYNIIDDVSGQSGDLFFEIIKYTALDEELYGLLIKYDYQGEDFKLAKKWGALLSIDGETPVYLRYKRRPDYKSITSGGGGGQWVNMGGAAPMYTGSGVPSATIKTETVICFLSKKQLYRLTNATNVSVILVSEPKADGKQKSKKCSFSEENFSNLKRFYKECVYNK
jgi:hypothetical protein